MPSTEEIAAMVKKLKRRTKKKSEHIPTKNLLGTGSSLLNLACSNRIEGAFYKGGTFHLVGDSDSGKTMLTMTIFAEASINSQFEGYRFIHDNAEGGALMDVESFFGKATKRRMSAPPRGTSEWVEDFYYNLDELYDEGEPFIYILDSMDSINSRADEKQFKAEKKARADGKEVSGSYGTAKARANSQGLRRAQSKLAKTGSILIIVSQTRDAFGVRFGPKSTSGGGRALKFYSRLQLWTATVKTLKRTVNKIPHQIGIMCKVSIRKNHITGKKGSVEFPIFNSYGIDDIGSCVDWLVVQRRWRKVKGKIDANDLGLTEPRDALIGAIEEDKSQCEMMKRAVAEEWMEIEKACCLKRKRRYE